MQNIQEKIKSIALVGLFVCLFLASSLSGPTPAAAAVETVSTQIAYQSQVVNTEMTYHSQVVSDLQVETQSLETESMQLEASESDEDVIWLNWWKRIKKVFYSAKSLAWSG